MGSIVNHFHDSMIRRVFVDTDVGQFHIRCSRESPSTTLPLVMLHASPASSLSLVPFIKTLGQTRPCYAPDTMGFGDTTVPPESDPQVADYANWVLKALNELGLTQFDLYGSHTGAHIAVELAISEPERVRRVILDGIAMFEDHEKQQLLSHYAPAVEEDDIGSQLNWAWHFVRDQGVYFPYFDRTSEKLRNVDMPNAGTLHRITVDVLKALRTYHLGYRAAFSHNDRERLPLMRQPTLVTAFDADPLKSGVGVAVELLNHGVSEIISDNNPTTLCARICDFLDDE